MDEGTLLTVRQVARYLQIAESTVYGWAQSRRIPALKIGHLWRFRRQDLKDWLDGQTRGYE